MDLKPISTLNGSTLGIVPKHKMFHMDTPGAQDGTLPTTGSLGSGSIR